MFLLVVREEERGEGYFPSSSHCSNSREEGKGERVNSVSKINTERVAHTAGGGERGGGGGGGDG